MKINIWPKVILIFGILLLILTLHKNLQKDWDDFKKGVEIQIDNFFYSMSPERSRPISTVEKETQLKVTLAMPFNEFSQSDWDAFWNLIYGVYELDKPDNPRLPKKARQLTLEEIQDRLIEEWPTPFSYFKEAHWGQFWKMLLKK